MQRFILALSFALFAGSVFADDSPPQGRWKAVSGIRLSEGAAVVEAKESAAYIGKTLRFSADAVDGPPPFKCANARFAWSDMPAEGFFQGFAGNPKEAAINARLTQLPNPARTLGVTCDTGVFDFHMRDDDTMLIMLDLVVYTFQRQK